MEKTLKRKEKGLRWVWLFWAAVSPLLGASAPTPTPSLGSDGDFYVLCYHRFWDKAMQDAVDKKLAAAASMEKSDEKRVATETCYEMPVTEFLWQMNYLKENKFTVISEAQLMDYWSKGTPLPPRSVLLTFDDGFRTIYRDAFPVVKSLFYPSTLFLYTNFVSGGDAAKVRDEAKGREPKVNARVEALTLADIQEMEKAGMVVESHTASHLNMGLEREKKGTEAFAKRLHYELNEPIDYILNKFGRKPQWIAYPFGVYDPTVLKATQEAGYQLAFTVNPGPNDRTVPPLMLKRNLVLYPIGHDAFAKMLQDKVLHLKDLSPADGALIDSTKPTISARLTDDIDPKSVRLQIGEPPHSMRVKYDAKKGLYFHEIKADLNQGGHIFKFSAKDMKGQTRVYNWYFRVKHKKLAKKLEGKGPSDAN
jgi:peptidoglycan/xylan/chitin deacetylase (PgdA/CDA1 family)